VPGSDSNPARVLAIAAHPDDLDFGAAGSTAALVAAGTEVTYLLCTRGDQGGFDDTPREQMPLLREKEQRDAAAAVGVHDVRFLDGFRDGWLEPTPDLVEAIVRVIRQVRPERVLVSSPERNWERIGASHPDHLATGEATVRAIYPAARNPFAFEHLLSDEGLQPWSVSSLWLMADPKPDTYVDITATFALKVAALRAHVSQTAHNPGIEDMLRTWARSTAESGGLAPDVLAEAFRAVPLPA
jgi:LmbE family N-acetylglucosaminyl deacetylase